jgi:hypothetical protein
MRIHKIGVFGDHNPLFRHGNLTDNRILGVIACREIERVNRVVSVFCEKSTESAREVRIEEKLHVKAR